MMLRPLPGFDYRSQRVIDELVRTSMFELVNAREDYIRNMMRLLGLTEEDLSDYVLDPEPIVTEFSKDLDLFELERHVFRIVDKYTFRRKTAEEKQAEKRAADLLERHSGNYQI